MKGLNQFLDTDVDVVISGDTRFVGTLIDIGQDIFVIFNGCNYLYIPLLHLHQMNKAIINTNTGKPISRDLEDTIMQAENNSFSYRNTLNNVKGKFIEVYVTGDRSIHGYVTSVLNDYIVFFSPVFKTLFISMHHLKWFTPYSTEQTPYTLDNSQLPVVPSSVSLVRNFEEQIKKYVGQLVIFDMGEVPEKVGLLKDVSNNIIELINASGKSIIWKLNHLKTMHLP
ncbi:DUF2642 domain-containing protein [Bacillus halotolerans]|uniref:DUF2642 domain-containing protein n=1 Tax=Bacillus halotolerans TaxID=260554 RepID=A0A9Q4HQ16_9BACI|nr:DUF2642 domain-containing protein [Bacillus halotolerans]MCP9297766.1 DUF2642 domain-containing protein [Bacillus halotolerans]MCY9185633.1 DUF2642 domain-containing protein [Bacillus halotolerans]MCY9200908.1 DUF2642 domain-containing protein [Bacillus halotolerans]MEC1649089.1 DUF2642 domain-containing protein [Bacillus halotolerans]PRS25602.1 DUF2642 domain-containing protein [Bacillus halotolerans]